MEILLHENAHIPQLITEVSVAYNALDIEIDALAGLDISEQSET